MDPGGGSAQDPGLIAPQSSSNTLEIHLPRHKISWSSHLLSFAVVGLLSYLALQALRIRVENRSLFSWWNGNEGGKYSRYMSLFMLLTFYQGSQLLYWLISALKPPAFQLTKSNIAFLSGTLLSYIRLPSIEDPKKQTGILTPKQLCQTVLLHNGDGDDLFDQWYADSKNRRLQGDVANDPDYALTFPDVPVAEDDKSKDFTGSYQAIQKHVGYYGVYPSAKDTTSWMGCIQAWANGGLFKTRVAYKWYLVKGGDIYVLLPNEKVSPPFDSAKDPSMWFDDQPDNFLGRYGIKMDSPLVTFFVAGKAYVKNVPTDQVNPESLYHLIGEDFSDDNPGGWLGFMYGKGPDTAADAFYNELFTSVDAQKAPPSDPRTCNALNNGLKGAGVAALSSAPMLLPLMAEGPAGIAIALVGTVLAAVGGGLDKGKCNTTANDDTDS